MLHKDYFKTLKSGVKLFRNYSDSGMKIMQHPTEIAYDEAVDIEGAPYTYEETEESIEISKDVTENQDTDIK